MDKITGRQISAARALCGMTQANLAADADISVPTLKRMEGSEGEAAGLRNNVGAVRKALEAAGVEFIPENGGGAGVRLRKSAKVAEDQPKPVGPATDAVDKMDADIAADKRGSRR